MEPENNEGMIIKPETSSPSPEHIPESDSATTERPTSAAVNETPQPPAPAPDTDTPALDTPTQTAPTEITSEQASDSSIHTQPTSPQQTQVPVVSSQPDQTADSQTPSGTGAPLTPIAPQPAKHAPRKKLIIGVIVAALVFILGAAGYVFGYYIPNKPENVWKTGLERTGDAVDEIMGKLTDKNNAKKLEQSSIKTDYDVTFNDSRYQGSFEALLNKKSGTYALDITNDSDGTKHTLTANGISLYNEETSSPEVFVKLQGLDIFGDVPEEIRAYENRWITVFDASVLQMLDSEEQSEANKPELTHEDYAAFAKIINDTTREYVFTNDAKKAILVQKSVVGPEKINDINTYKYTAGLSEKHLQQYCTTMATRLIDSPSFKKVPFVEADKLQDYKDSATKTCNEPMDVDNVVLDVWVDRKYKLLHQIGYQIPDGPYVSIGQKYTGGDVVELFVRARYKKDAVSSDVAFNLTTNMKSLQTTAKFVGTFKEPRYKTDVTVNFDAKSHDGEIKAERPQDAVPLEEVFQKIFGYSPQEQTDLLFTSDGYDGIENYNTDASVDDLFSDSDYYNDSYGQSDDYDTQPDQIIRMQ